MGQVWRAHDTRLERTVAIKVIAPQLLDDPEFLVRFLREAQSIARISHPNVVSVLDFGEDQERPFLVMEYVPGEALSDLTGAPMDPDRARAVMVQAAAAAGAAHEQGIVHRDIKPANILITEDGRVKLVDFGIASAQGVERITATGTAIGSPHYISPEQTQGDKATPRSDVYSLGVVLFELLAGRRPFEGDSVAAIAMAHVERDPGGPADDVPGLGAELDEVTRRCLAKRPEDRFADGSALAEALGAGGEASTRVLAAAAPSSDTMVLPAGALSRNEDAGEERPWRAVIVGLGIGLVLLALVVGAFALMSSRQAPGSDAGGGHGARGGVTTPPESQDTEDDPPAVDDTEPAPEDSLEETPAEEETPPDDVEEDDEGEDGSSGRGPGGKGPPGQDQDKEKKKE